MLPSDLAGAATTVLSDINVDPVVIERIRKVINESSDSLSSPMADTNSAPLEGIGGGSTFAYHAELAGKHVRKAMVDLVTGLSGLETVVNDYNNVQDGIDTDTAVAGFKLKARMEASDNCFTPPTTEAPEVCSPPEALGEGN